MTTTHAFRKSVLGLCSAHVVQLIKMGGVQDWVEGGVEGQEYQGTCDHHNIWDRFPTKVDEGHYGDGHPATEISEHQTCDPSLHRHLKQIEPDQNT